jgi:hypothetical protein
MLVINGYLWDTMKKIDSGLAAPYKGIMPFFPLSDAASGTESWEDKAYVIYDRMMQLSRGPFYPVKSENILYSVKGNEEQTIQWSLAIQIIVDRMDDAAQDANEWNRKQASPEHVYFHHLKAFQILRRPTEARDFSNRPYYISQLMVEAEYHFTDSLEDLITS